MVHFIFIAPMHSYVTNVLVYNLHMTIFSRVYSYVTRVYSYVTRMYSYVLVCYSYVLVCYSYVTRMYSCVTRMLLVCYSCVVLVTIDRNTENVFYFLIKNLYVKTRTPAVWLDQLNDG